MSENTVYLARFKQWHQFWMETTRFGRRRVNFLMSVFIIMIEIKDQAVIVQNLLGSYKKNYIKGEIHAQ